MNKQITTHTKTDRVITIITTWIAGTVALALLIWGIITLIHLHSYEETDDAQVEAYINPITARVSGFVKEIRYDENQDVKKEIHYLLLITANTNYNRKKQEQVCKMPKSRCAC